MEWRFTHGVRALARRYARSRLLLVTLGRSHCFNNNSSVDSVEAELRDVLSQLAPDGYTGPQSCDPCQVAARPVCPSCSRVYRLGKRMLGKRFRCKNCPESTVSVRANSLVPMIVTGYGLGVRRVVAQAHVSESELAYYYVAFLHSFLFFLHVWRLAPTHPQSPLNGPVCVEDVEENPTTVSRRMVFLSGPMVSNECTVDDYGVNVGVGS